jgi:hypothetical protein
MKAGAFDIFAPAILLAVVSLAGAQQPPPSPPPVPPAPPNAGSKLGNPPAALSVPDPLAGFRPGPRDLYQSPDGSDRFQHLSRYPAPPPPIVVAPGVYFPSPYYYPYAHGTSAPYYETSMAETYRMSMAETYLRRQREAARGGLVLESVPDTAQVLVDGYYVGLTEEFGPGGRAINLAAGAHHIELRALGYETLAFSVMIEPHSIVRYRGAMQPLATKPAAATAPSQPTAAKSFYVIPNCYAGDKPPTGALPKGCDVKNLQTRK